MSEPDDSVGEEVDETVDREELAALGDERLTVPVPGMEPEQMTPEQQLAAAQKQLLETPLEQLEEAIGFLRDENQQKAIALHNDHGVQMDPTIVIMQRLEAIVQFGLDEHAAARVNVAFERTMNQLLDQAAHQIRVQKLTAGLQDMPPSDLLRSGVPGVPQPRPRRRG